VLFIAEGDINSGANGIAHGGVRDLDPTIGVFTSPEPIPRHQQLERVLCLPILKLRHNQQIRLLRTVS